MANQGGLKHVATEPTRLESKREGRRHGAGAAGAAGRAAALRRAPSDSDCSGETASLSADSGDRAIRPAPQPPPRGKSRSRRRGSEWEVLEGLKDGQRFEKRPEVFNGYLHKKRKWPLKGWHKRFFVVDGGILVYARSPTDVARGRLHGSVDVGLSVISAKARRRRIDIDADEFIYHLRAKTPDVFRTWLTVLKAHRLYRQHLLTFGARESVPKIHAPLEDLPATDTSSRTSHSAIEISTLSSFQKIQNMTLPLTCASSTSNDPSKWSCEFKTSVCGNKNQLTLNDWPCNKISSKLLPLSFDTLDNTCLELKSSEEREISSSDNVMEFNESFGPSPIESDNNSPVFSLNTTDAEKQIHSTELELSLRSPGLQSPILCQYCFNTPVDKHAAKKSVKRSSGLKEIVVKSPKIEMTIRNKPQQVATYCFSTHKVLPDSDQFPMRRSRKSTNLVKYRNMYCEPPLKKPFNTYMLLGNYSNNIAKEILTVNKKCDHSAFCNIVPNKSKEIQAQVDDKKSIEDKDANTTAALDRITEKLMMSIFDKIQTSQPTESVNIKSCINQVVKELYDSKTTREEAHPVIALFKSLLEYWLKKTSVDSIREAVRTVKSVDRQSNKHFTKDENTSSVNIENVNKQTQFHGISDINQNISRILVDIINKKGKSNKVRGPRINNESSDKERRIQEIERILKSTVYFCGTAQSRHTGNYIKITEANITDVDTSNSSSELSKIHDTLNRLITDKSLSQSIAKDFLRIYLDLLHESDSLSSDPDATDKSKANCAPKCETLADSIQKSTSEVIMTTDYADNTSLKQNKLDIDPGQVYLKKILDDITTIFCKRNDEEKNVRNDECASSAKRELEEKKSNKSIVVDLSKYNLERVSMATNPDAADVKSVTFKLKENQINLKETKSSLLHWNFSDVSKLEKDNKFNWTSVLSSKNSNKYFKDERNLLNWNTPFCYGLDPCIKDLKPYQTSSEATTKDYRLVNSDISLSPGFQSAGFGNVTKSTKSLNCDNDTQSCYIFSSLKKCPFQSKKRKQSGVTSDRTEPRLDTPTTTKDLTDKISVFENTRRTIDEKFILLLLENLTLLSKSMPDIHKDLNSLYVRLRKKHEKIIKNDDIPQGLSLLGKIYNDGQTGQSDKPVQDDETQYSDLVIAVTKDKATETLDFVSNKSDRAITVYTWEHIETGAQTDELQCKSCLKDVTRSCHDSVERISTNSTQTLTANAFNLNAAPMWAEKAISNQNWVRVCKKDCGISPMKYAFDNNDSSAFSFQPKADDEITLTSEKDSTIQNLKTINRHKLRQDLMKDIHFRTPSFKTSAHSQKKVDKNLNTDFKVYEMFANAMKEPKKSNSMFEMVVENLKSDDLKTIYRCSSENPISSG